MAHLYTTKRGSQNTAILLHLAKGKTLTRYEAILMFRVQNITARIAELRNLRIPGADGATTSVGIAMAEKTDPNGQTYAEYSIPCRHCRVEAGKLLSSLRRRAA